jgi:hypothetical protein
MIELHDLSSDDETFDTVSLSNKTHPSSNVCVSPGQCASDSIKYNSSNIKIFLKEQPTKYVLVENQKVNHAKPSQCWNRFALPAVKDENDRSVIIKNFATCRSCYTTYIYAHGSTKSLNSHKCSKEPSSTSSSPSFRYFNYYLFTIYFVYISSIKSSLNSKTNQFSSEKKKTLTSSLAKWICQSMRPISIVEDEGFLNIIQQCLRWNGGERYQFKP